MNVNDELVKMQKETVLAYFNLLSQHSPGEISKTAKNLSQNKQPGPIFKPGLPKYVAGLLILN
jgi:hypothetical protein